jgi:hypothetical protein
MKWLAVLFIFHESVNYGVVGCDTVCFTKWIPPQAEEYAAFIFTYSELYPPEEKTACSSI